nr:hypothetical protein [uncultured Serratia sp.]
MELVTGNLEWVIIEVSKCDTYGKVGRIVASVDSRYLADAFITGVERMEMRGEMKKATSLMYCSADRVRHCAATYGFHLLERK